MPRLIFSFYLIGRKIVRPVAWLSFARLVPVEGVEPPCLAAIDFEFDCVCHSATRARRKYIGGGDPTRQGKFGHAEQGDFLVAPRCIQALLLPQ